MIVSAIGLAWSLFWLIDPFDDVPTIWELIAPLVSVVCVVLACVFAVTAIRRGVKSRGTAIAALFVGSLLIIWGVTLVPVSVSTTSAA